MKEKWRIFFKIKYLGISLLFFNIKSSKSIKIIFGAEKKCVEEALPLYYTIFGNSSKVIICLHYVAGLGSWHVCI